MIRMSKHSFARWFLLSVFTGLSLIVFANIDGVHGGGKKKKPKGKDEKKKPVVPEKKALPKDKTPPMMTLKGHKDWIFSVQFSSDGKSLITASRDKTIKVWDLASKKATATLEKNPTDVKTAIFSPDGKLAVSTTGAWNKKAKKWEGEIRFWDIKNSKVSKTVKGHGDVIEAIAFSPDGNKLITAGKDQTAIIWDVKTGKALQTLKGHKGIIHDVAFNKDGSKVATASADKTVKIWNVADGKEVGLIKDHKRDVTSVAFTDDGKIITGSLDETVKVSGADGKEIRSLKAPEGIWAVAVSPDGKYLAASGWNDTVKVWSLADGKELFYRNGHERTVTGVVFSPDSSKLVSVGIDSVIQVWEVPKK